MEILKLALTTALVLKSINYDINAGKIIAAVDASRKEWGGTLM